MIWTQWKQARKIEQYEPGDTSFKNPTITNMVTKDPIKGISTGDTRLTKGSVDAILLSNWEWENELIEKWYHMEYMADDSSGDNIIYNHDDSGNKLAGYSYDDSSGRFMLFNYDDSSSKKIKFHYDDSSGPIKYDCDDSSSRYLWCDDDSTFPTGYDYDDSGDCITDNDDSSGYVMDNDDSSGCITRHNNTENEACYKEMIVIKNIEVKVHISRLSRVKDLTVQLYSRNKLIGENLANKDALDTHIYGGTIKDWNIKTINPFDVGLVLDYQPHPTMPSSELVYLRKVQMRVAYDIEPVMQKPKIPDCMSKKIPDIGTKN